MYKKILTTVTRIIWILFTISTIITIFILFKGTINSFMGNFLNGYIIFIFFFLFYNGFVTILNMSKLKWDEIRKRLLRFFILFSIFLAVNFVLTYLIKGKANIPDLSTPFGFAFGITFMDIIFIKERNNKKKLSS